MPHLPVQAVADNIDKGILGNCERGPTQNTLFADDNLLDNIWLHLKSALDRRIEASCMLLGNHELYLRRSPLSMVKCLKTTLSCLRTQLRACMNTIDLALSIADSKREDLVTITLTTWKISQKIFTLREVASLLGIVSNLSLTT